MTRWKDIPIIFYLFIFFLAFEVVVLSKQNMTLKKRILMFQQPDLESRIKLGSKMPPLTGLNRNGERISIDFSNSTNKTVLCFFSLTCPQCLAAIPEWRNLYETIISSGKGSVYGVIRDSLDAVQRYADGYRLNYPLIILGGNDKAIKDDFGIEGVPATCVVDTNGILVKAILGELDSDKKAEILDNINY